MFGDILETDYYEIIDKKADFHISTERSKFVPLFEEVISYSKKKDVMISSADSLIANDIIFDKSEGVSLYTTHPYKIANDLSNILHKKFGKWVKMNTIISNEHLTIFYDSRKIVSIFIITSPGDNPKKILVPVKIKDNIFLTPEIEIIDTYRFLYLPDKYDEWEKYIPREKRLMEEVMKRINIFKGGNEKKCDKCKEKKIKDVNKLKILLLNSYLADNESYVIIGHYALDIVNMKEIDLSVVEKIQIISSNKINEDIKNITTFISRYTDFKIRFKKQNLHIPKDFRTSRYTFYIQFPQIGNNKSYEKPFMDIFDSANFELIPYIKTNVGNRQFLVGNIYVVLRFLMIDLWVIRIIKSLNMINEKIIDNKIKYIIFNINKTKSMTKYKNQRFGLDYMGYHQDYNIAKKIENLKNFKFSLPYIPEKHLKEHGKYREV